MIIKSPPKVFILSHEQEFAIYKELSLNIQSRVTLLNNYSIDF